MEDALSALQRYGYKGRIVSIQHLGNLQEEIEEWRKSGSLSEDLYRKYFASMDFRVPNDFPEASSLITVAVPRPQTQAVFALNDELSEFIIPPTYFHYQEIPRRVEAVLSEILNQKGYRVARARLPEKLLAMHSGLGSYGKNNICYVPEMGSFLQLVSFYSDLPVQENNWQESQMMERCQKCSACIHVCPTGAITTERFLIHAERCLTFFNENPGDFPEWIGRSWHNCLIGCMLCQKMCPQNKSFLSWIGEKEEFSQEETILLLKGSSLDNMPPVTVEKLQRLDLVSTDADLNILSRNLRVLLDKG